jgi:hypothetical protein
VLTAESERLLPLQHAKHTVQVPTRRRIREAKVNQKPGPVFVVIPASSLSNSTLTSAKSAISMAKAIRVKITAKSATNAAIMPMTGMVANSAKKNAKNVATVATG